jgi:hypothetical protein
LHDQGGVFVALLAQGVEFYTQSENIHAHPVVKGQLTSNSVVECLLGQVAGLVWGIEDLIVEYGEVEGKTQADGVGWGQVCLGNLGSGLVCLERLVGRCLALVANGELCEVTVVITLPATRPVISRC